MLALEGPPAPRRRCRHLRLGLRPRRCGALEAKVLVLRLRTSPPPAMASGVMQTLVDLELPEKRSPLRQNFHRHLDLRHAWPLQMGLRRAPMTPREAPLKLLEKPMERLLLRRRLLRRLLRG